MLSLPSSIRKIHVGMLFIMLGVPTAVSAQQIDLRSSGADSSLKTTNHKRQMPLAPLAEIPYEKINPETRLRIQGILDRPTIRSVGQSEAFNCKPEQYSWLLDNPQLCVRLWRALGAKVTDIECQGMGHFSYHDDQGSHVTWETVLSTNEYRIWLAEGKLKAGFLIPAVNLRAVLAVRFSEGSDIEGNLAIRHQIELAVQTDSHAVTLVTRLMGASAPHLAQQFVSQIEMFFGAMAWYLDQHPRHAVRLLADLDRPETIKTTPVRPASFLRSGS